MRVIGASRADDCARGAHNAQTHPDAAAAVGISPGRWPRWPSRGDGAGRIRGRRDRPALPGKGAAGGAGAGRGLRPTTITCRMSGAVTATTQGGPGKWSGPVSTGCGASSSVSAPRPLMRAPAWPVLGARFLDRQGRELPPGGTSLLPSTVCDPQAPSRRDLAQLGLDGFRQVAGRSVIGAAIRRSAPLVVMPAS